MPNPGAMWPLTRRQRKPDLEAESGTARQQLLPSQLEQTLTYGWHGHGKTEAREFFESLGAASDTAGIVEGLGKRRPA